MNHRWLSFLLLIPLLFSRSAEAQNYGPATDYVAWTVTAVPDSIPPGGTVQLTFDAEMDRGWKMYALDSPPPSRGVRLRFADWPDGVTQQGEVRQAPPKEGYDPNFGVDVRYFERRAQLMADVQVDAGFAPGTLEVGGQIEFMICNDRICLPPTRAPFTASVVVDLNCAAAKDAECKADLTSFGPLDTPAKPAETSATPPANRQDAALDPPNLMGDAGVDLDAEAAVLTSARDLDAARSGGLWGFLLLAMGAGLAALLTPCVFPMIPLTVSYFTKHADNRREAFRMASVYGVSIVLTFTGLGLILALVVGAAGAQSIAANPWVNLFLAVVLIGFGLSLLGLYELRVPSGMLNYVNRQGNERQGYVGVLFMGLTLTLVSFSCTAPFVGGLLAATAGGEWSYPLLGMLVFSTTFALPFVLFALFPKALNSLPRSGAWMNLFKVVLGFVELAAAIKFLSNADLIWQWGMISRPLAISVTVVIFFLTGLYLLGKLHLLNEPAPEQVGVGRLLSSILFIGLSLYMLPGLFGAPLNKLDAYLPPRQATDVSLLSALPAGGGAHDEGWIQDDIEAAFAAAQAQARPVFIDFTGYTCTNCREMEANVFPRPAVAERFARDFVLLRLYTDDLEKGDAALRYQLQLTGTVALPTYAVVHPESRRLISKTSGIMNADAFVAFLDSGTAGYEQSLAAR